MKLYAPMIQNQKADQVPLKAKERLKEPYIGFLASNTPVEIREYDRLFEHPSPGDFSVEDISKAINNDSITVFHGFGEKELSKSKVSESFQFQRKGYYIKDIDSTSEKHVFNKTVSLRDNWKK